MAIVVSELSVTPFGEVTPVLDALSFGISRGERVLLLGPSGAGKSTLLLALSGVLQTLESFDVRGEVTADGSGLLLQNYSDATITDTVLRDVAFGAESAGFEVASVSALVAEALERVGLAGIDTDRSPATLSGGELQRMCLAGLLTLRPAVLLLDEPTSQLDSASAAEVRQAVEQFLRESGATAIIAEHIFEPWLPLVNRVLVLGPTGSLEADGTWPQVLADHVDTLEGWGLWFSANTVAGQRLSDSVVALVGPSGAGKSTELRRRLDAALAEGLQCGWVPQNPALALSGSTVLGCLSQGSEARRAHELLDELGLAHLAAHNPHEISGGEERRLAIACAVIGGGSHIFLDEPTVGLDRHSWQSVMDLIARVSAAGTTVTLATHDPLVIAAAGQVVEINRVPKPQEKAAAVPLTPLGMLAISAAALVTALAFTSWIGALAAVGWSFCCLGCWLSGTGCFGGRG